MSGAYQVLRERGFISQVTHPQTIEDLFAEGRGPVTVYIGYDPTADSLHVGSLMGLMVLWHLKQHGHRAIAVLGGGTAMVGDPSGKTELRQLLSRADIIQNGACIQKQLASILGKDALVVDNADWLLGLSYVDFLRDVGRHFSVNRMLTAESYKLRLERGLSFIEFNYQLLQAYDFHQLLTRYGCLVQMGGDDQWGNIVAGIDLCRRLNGQETYGLTYPLLLTAAGEKMGKTAKGALWLDPEKVSPYEYYQYWVNIDDRDLVRMLGYFTTLPMTEIALVATLDGSELNAAKNILGYEATAFVHGQEAARAAHAAALAAFGGRTIPSSILPSSALVRSALADLEQVPTTVWSAPEMAQGVSLVELLHRTGLAESKGAARRLIAQGGVRVNDDVVREPNTVVMGGTFAERALLLRAGKKRIHRVRWEE